MSEFPKSGLGSWAQWRRRAEVAGEWFIAVNGEGATEIEDEWEARHLEYYPECVTGAETDIEEIEHSIADRKAG